MFKKAVKMTLREKKQFIVFCLMYTILIFWTSYSIEIIIREKGSSVGVTSLFIALGASLFLSLLYAWIIVSRKRRTWATLKCIGYTNGDVNKLIMGQIIFTTVMGFLIVVEILFHYNAIVVYWQAAYASENTVDKVPLITLTPVIATCILFLAVQLISILVANRKVLKVRPIIALKKVGE